jgi:hypothetical protein
MHSVLETYEPATHTIHQFNAGRLLSEQCSLLLLPTAAETTLINLTK